ncbi:hypothetical protein HOS18_gp27 [Aeromonas phage CF7]|uniref:Uncharacterized protein n=1 Tax=Aeromonas phage CF7 TaxID=2507411 RepID=A0A249XL91_9CAUD|nr:hypothetical protein HOS18_gp27 [Aeromonas phage CF7]ASZ71973.1 hypothetical protein CF7_27 [Aeromonas phage CF7]
MPSKAEYLQQLTRYKRSANLEAKVQYLSDKATKATAEGAACRQKRKSMATSHDAKRPRQTGFSTKVKPGSKTDATINAYYRAKHGDNMPRG